jgi:hypothetical protein
MSDGVTRLPLLMTVLPGGECNKDVDMLGAQVRKKTSSEKEKFHFCNVAVMNYRTQRE